MVNTMRHIAELMLLIPASALADSTNPFDDGNNVSGLASRLAVIIRSALVNTEYVIIAFGLVFVASGLMMMKNANKLQISPRYGAVVAIMGFILTSPRACSNMGAIEILEKDNSQIVETILEEGAVSNENVIIPN